MQRFYGLNYTVAVNRGGSAQVKLGLGQEETGLAAANVEKALGETGGIEIL